MQIRRVRQFPLVLVGALVFVIATLSAQDVRYNFMPGTDFSKFHTYKWISIQGGAHPNQIVDAQMKQSVDSQLILKGLNKIEDDKANLYIGYQIAVNKEKQWNAFGMGGIRWGGGMATATSSPISVRFGLGLCFVPRIGRGRARGAQLVGEDDSLVSVRPVLDRWPTFRDLLPEDYEDKFTSLRSPPFIRALVPPSAAPPPPAVPESSSPPAPQSPIELRLQPC